MLDSKQSKAYYLIIFLLLIAAVYVSYQTVDVSHQLSVTGNIKSELCNISSKINCADVISSEFSKFYGLPLGVWGLFFYISILFLTLHNLFVGYLPQKNLISVHFFFFLCAAAISAALFAISKQHIGAYCPLCIKLYLINLFLFLTSFFAYRAVSKQFFVLFRAIGFFFKSLIILIYPKNFFNTITAFLIIGLAVYASLQINNKLLVKYEIEAVQKKSPVEDYQRKGVKYVLDGSPMGDYYTGYKGSKIEIVKYADYQCPACRRMAIELKEWLKPYQGKYKFIYQDFPLDKSCNKLMERELHQYACYASELVRCAGELGKFFEADRFLNMRDSDYYAGKTEDVKLKLFNDISNLDVDSNLLKECMDSNRQLMPVRRGINNGAELGVNGTPAIFINSVKLNVLSKEVFDNAIQNILDR